MPDNNIIKEYNEIIIQLLSQTRLSFLIGAGCSLCADLPLMEELTNSIFDELNPDNTSDTKVKKAYDLIKYIRKIYKNGENVTIEDYLSEIQDYDAILQRQELRGINDPNLFLNSTVYNREHTQILLRKIKEFIGKKLGDDIKTIEYHRKFCRAIHFVLRKGRVRSKHPINYFILNYDTLFEDALSLERISFVDGFIGGATAWWNPKNFNEKVNNTNIDARVYKLHGSIDWIRPENCDFPVRIRKTLPSDEVIGNGEPVLIYPSSFKYKETQIDPFAQMIESFRMQLSESQNNVLAIIGYGFNDEHINFEIMNGIKLSNGSLSLIVFLGKKELPKSLDIMINNKDICSQVLILGKRGIWKDGKKFYEFQDDSDWYQFEYLSALLNGENQ